MHVNAQNFLILGDKSYPCTTKIDLSLDCKACGFIEDFSILFAKNGENGFVRLSIELWDNQHHLGGDAVIYLGNGEIIKLIDQDKRDFVNQTASNVYNLSSTQISKLKASDIYSVRFSIKCSKCVSSTITGDYTANNSSKLSTSSLISDLFSGN